MRWGESDQTSMVPLAYNKHIIHIILILFHNYYLPIFAIFIYLKSIVG